jgi:hypothetical protein
MEERGLTGRGRGSIILNRIRNQRTSDSALLAAAIVVVTSTVATHGRYPQAWLPVILLSVLLLSMLNNHRIARRKPDGDGDPFGRDRGFTGTADRAVRRVVAAATVTSSVAGLGIVLANLGAFAVSVLAVPLLAWFTVTAWKLTRMKYQAQYVLRRSLTFYVLLGALALAAAVWTAVVSELLMVGMYLVLLSHGVVSVYKQIPVPVANRPA